jgi:hypothetical protein
MKKKIQILSVVTLGCLALLSISFGFSGNKNLSFSQKVSAASLIRAAYNQSDAETIDDILLINEVVQTKYDTTATTVSFQGNLSGIDGGKVDLNDRSFGIKRGTFYWSTDTDRESTESANGYFGAENTFSVEGEEVVRDFYIPKPLKLEFENGRDLEFSRDEGIKFRWNSDERNEYPLIVVLQYIEADGKELVTKQLRFNDRDEAAEITAEDLKEFPSDTRLNLYAGRGNGKIVTIRDKETSLAGFTVTSVPGIIVK